MAAKVGIKIGRGSKEYKIEAWHEIFGKLENDIEIKT
jgi:hypothetical protein